jgi:SAM-dependent methyltransferase
MAYEEIHVRVRQVIDSLYPTGEDVLVLDAASGNGYMSEWLNERGFRVTALDNSTDTWKVDSVKCRYADLNHDLELNDNTFDLTLSIETIEHLYNPFHFIRELSRVTKSKGMVIISTPNVHSIRSRLKYLFCGLPFLFEYIKDDAMGQHISPVSMGQFLYAFNMADLKIVDIFSVGRKSGIVLQMVLSFVNWFTFWGILVLKYQRRCKADHYLNVLSRNQLKELNNNVILIVVAKKG